MDTKKLTFTVMMGALGGALFLISQAVLQIAPSVALDLSLLAVFIAGIYAGPKSGFATGLIAGILPGIMFGPLGAGGILGLIALPIGKGLTGLTIGLLATYIKPNKFNESLIKYTGNSPYLIKSFTITLCIPLILLSYTPEAIFTYTYFTALIPLFLNSAPLAAVIVKTVMTKAIIEVTIMGIIIGILIAHNGINKFIKTHFHKTNQNNN